MYHCHYISKKIIREEARKIEHARNTFYISHDEIIKISRECAEALGKIRSLVANNSQEVLTGKILHEYNSRNVSAENIKRRLTAVRLQDMPVN